MIDEKMIKKELENILANRHITSVFQPIIELTTGETIGYESLSRGPKNSPLYRPDKLFGAAKKYNRIWDLELLCREKAIEKASEIIGNKHLFINVDPNIIKDEKFKRGFTKSFLKKNNVSPESVIFEITENSAIDDYESFNQVLNNYTNQGYKIAIDDCGSGYSGLKTILKTQPHYLKIDMDLIRGIDKDLFKQALITSLKDLANSTGIKLIAEGIENEQELKTLIKIGVHSGQGFYFKKPFENFSPIPEEVKLQISNYTKQKNIFDVFNTNYIGDLAEPIPSFDINTKCIEIKVSLDTNEIDGACIVESDYPKGLIMKNKLNSVFAKNYGLDVFSKKPVSIVMDKRPLIVDYFTDVNKTAEISMNRENSKVYDYIIITRNSKYYGIVTIKKLLQFTSALEKNYARNLNPLTGLPGNIMITRTIDSAICYGKECCILYFDLDNFKVYNDVYGFENGDKIIELTADLIKNIILTNVPYSSFVGHIGGDDFFALITCSHDECKNICKKIIDRFDKEVLNYFNETDSKNGYIISEDRHGNVRNFKLTSLSIAGYYGDITKFNSPAYLAQYMSKLKKVVKKQEGSNYIIADKIV